MNSAPMAGGGADDQDSRPYRSHLLPACLSCRKRKSRCKTTEGSDSCILCLAHGTECVFPERQISTSSRRRHAVAKQKHSPIGSALNGARQRPLPALQGTGQNDAPENVDESMFSLLSSVAEGGQDNPHVVNAALAEDGEEIGAYLSCISSPAYSQTPRYSAAALTMPKRSAAFTTIPKRPLGHLPNQSFALQKCQVVEKLIEPFGQDVVDLYFDYANICLPLFFKHGFYKLFREHKQAISPALLSNMYANALIYWSNSPKLVSERCPDIRFCWLQASEAVHSELLLGPGLSSIFAIILNVSGRPSTSLFINGGLIATGVGLANSIGLHRDPTDWNVPESEKSLRIVTWWSVVLHDRCLAYGTPPHVNRAHHDVRLLHISDLVPASVASHEKQGAEIFIALVTLSEVLSRYLEKIYDLNKESNFPESLHGLEVLLENWKHTLPRQIYDIAVRGHGLDVPGAANLRLAALAVQLVLKRLQLDICRHARDTASLVYLRQALDSAREIVLFVQGLDEVHVRGFWTAVNFSVLASATTLLLRHALRADNDADKSGSFSLARSMIDSLRRLRQLYQWDLADDCLETCGDIVDRMVANQPAAAQPDLTTMDFTDIDASMIDELFAGAGGVFETELWDLT